MVKLRDKKGKGLFQRIKEKSESWLKDTQAQAGMRL